MAGQNIEMPRFASASSGTTMNWGEIDNFDVDMLAEYLLEDGNPHGGEVTFDFNIDGSANDHNSTLVSPENSEDGNLPPIAEGMHMLPVQQPPPPPQQQTYQQAPGLVTNQMPPQMPPQLPNIPLAPAPTTGGLAVFPTLTAPQMSSMGMGATPPELMYQQHPGADTGGGGGSAPPKRRRLDHSVAGMPVAVQNAAAAAGILNGQQLAAAAQQAMQQQGGGLTTNGGGAAPTTTTTTGGGRKKSQAQVDRRRERNRILARRTRLRKKFFFESLQKEVMELQQENLKLKNMVRQNVEGEAGKKILEECDAAEKLPPGVLEACGELGKSELDSKDFNLVQSIQKSQHSFIITDPSLADNPIVFASDDFLKLTGYTREQVLGRNCRFLQGTDTSKESVDEIREGLKKGEDVSATLVNYTADGTPFWNKLFVAALRDAQDNIVNFIGVIAKVASPEPGHRDHGKALPTVKTENNAEEGKGGNEEVAETTIAAIEDSVTAAVAAAAGSSQ